MTRHQGRDGLSLLDRNTPLRLLLIEDSSADSELVLAMLEGEFAHAEIEVESSLETAMIRMSEARFDLVLADLSLPDAQGAPVVRAVRASHPETALLVLTGRVDGDLALWALAEGAQDYLVKGQHDGPRLATALLHALQRQRAEEEAHRYLQLARGLLDALDAPTCAIDSHSEIVAVNRAWQDFTTDNDGSSEGCGVGVSYLDVCEDLPQHSVGSSEAAIVGQGIRQVLAGELDRFQLDYPCHAPDEDRWFSVRVTPAEINDAAGAVITHLDITEMHNVQQSLAHQSLHDTLTGLPNRVLLSDRVGQAIDDAERQGRGVAVSHLDLDKFQRVNDSLGYRVGDAVLVQVSERLLQQLRPGDTLGRSSGDEFIVLWRDLDPGNPEEAMTLSENLIDALTVPFDVEGASVTVSACVGVAVGASGEHVDDLLRAADVARHGAKSRGPGNVQVFTIDMRGAAERRMTIEAELREELSGDITQLVLHYQPVVELATGEAVAVEALVRWQHPVRGLLGPDQFIPVAESSGLIHRLGEWVLAQAVRDAAALTDRGRELDVAVNWSVKQLNHDAADQVHRALEQGDLEPSRLLLEVTETAFVEDEEAAAAALDAVSALGVKIAIDDFGTGYSSLLYLRRYPISTLKIDRAFVVGIGERADDEAICGSIVSLAVAVDASCIAEGVETAEQYAALRSLGCRLGQGYLWSAAVPIRDLPEALDRCRRISVPALRLRSLKTLDSLDPDVTARIVRMHAEGASLNTIAAALNRSVERRPGGVRWTARAIARELAG